MLRSRRRPRYGPHLCAVSAALLLLLSVSLLYSRLDRRQQHHVPDDDHSAKPFDDAFSDEPLLRDSDPNPQNNNKNDDLIDVLDVVDDDDNSNSNEEEILRESEEDFHHSSSSPSSSSSSIPGYYFDHLSSSIRRSFDHKRSIDELDDAWADDHDYSQPFLPSSSTPTTTTSSSSSSSSSSSVFGFGSDDIPVDERVRAKLVQIKGIEDALLLKPSPLRDGWGPWFDAKSDFLRKDRMFKSNLDLVNPLTNPLLQDPDTFAATAFALTRADKMILKAMLTPFTNPLAATTPGIKLNVARTLKHTNSAAAAAADPVPVPRRGGNGVSGGSMSMYPDGKTWGYFPGVRPRLSFSKFMDSFFTKGKCSFRVFMVWNSPTWKYGVRHQRGLESLLFHHPHACVVVFSETVELDFFKQFVNDGFKVAVVMPNLNELLKDTPASIFASVWHEWKTTKYYPTHYSELVRLAALHKYGGTYLDTDVIVLRPISSLINTVGMEDSALNSPLNGAVMAFRKNSSFIKECLSEFYASYDDALLRWNGADLLTRIAGNFSVTKNIPSKQLELKVQQRSIFFPISSEDIARYFKAPTTVVEKAHQDALLEKILKESYTFHLWDGLTYAVVPEPDSLVARVVNRRCIRCLDVL